MDAFSLQANLYALGFERLADRVRHALVLTGNQAPHLFHNGDFGAEAAEYLRELEADIASADDDQSRGQGVELEQRRVGQRPHLIPARKVGQDGAAANVDEEAVGFEHVVADPDRRRRQEARMTLKEGAVRHALEPRFEA